MDLWDLTRLLFRRWYFALPILLTSLLITIVAGQAVKPDYRATGNVVFIPAPGDPSDSTTPGKAPNRPKNPWGDLGFEALGNAVILKVMDQATLKSLEDEGLTESVTVQMAERSPMFIIEAVGKSKAQATATVKEIIKLLTAEVARQQTQYGVMPQDTLTTLTLTDGSDVEIVTSKVKRVLIVTVGLGLLLTCGGTIGLDVLLRWRKNRRRGSEENEDDPSDGSVDDAPARARERIQPRFARSATAEERTQIIPTTKVPSAGGPSGGDGERAAGRSRVAAASGGGGGRRSASENGVSRIGSQAVGGNVDAESSVEATIVLPMPRQSWANRDHSSGGR